MIATTALDLTSLAAQWGGWGVLLVVGIVGVRAVWTKLSPHLDASLSAKLKRYEATTMLTAKLQDTLASLIQQHTQMIEIMERIGCDGRANKRSIREIAKLMEYHACLQGVNVKAAIFDSDEITDESG